MDEYERMVERYGWPEPTIDEKQIYSSAIKHLPFLEARVSDRCLELVGEWVEDIVFAEHETLGGYYNPMESTVYIYCEHKSTIGIQEGQAWRFQSPIVHEIGHVIHDFHGVSLFNDDYHAIDNRGSEYSDWDLGVVKTNEFSSQAITLWGSFREQNIQRIRRYQERNISEFLAVAFEQWVTSPALMIHKQSSVVRFFDSWVGESETDTFEEFQCLCDECPSEPRAVSSETDSGVELITKLKDDEEVVSD